MIVDPAQAARGEAFPLKQTNLVFRNLGLGRFADVTAASGSMFQVPAVGRGIAAGDIDNDGDVDLVIANNNGPARLLQNDTGAAHPWLGLRLLTADGKRDALGAAARLAAPAGSGSHTRHSHTDGSYASAGDPRVLFGLGDATGLQTVAVTWPDGATESWPGLAPGHYHTLVQGRPAPP